MDRAFCVAALKFGGAHDAAIKAAETEAKRLWAKSSEYEIRSFDDSDIESVKVEELEMRLTP